jgi:hypothetical protein
MRAARDHEMVMGQVGLGYEVTIDGTPGLVPEDAARPGRLPGQIVNHARRQGNNCDSVEVVCTVTFVSLYVLTSIRDIAEGTEVAFTYQEPHRVNGVPAIAGGAFWLHADSLAAVPRGMQVVCCWCQPVRPNGWGRLTHPLPSPPLPLHPTLIPHRHPCYVARRSPLRGKAGLASQGYYGLDREVDDSLGGPTAGAADQLDRT